MIFFKLLRYDLKNGLLHFWKRYVLAFLLFLMACGDFLIRWDMMCYPHPEIRKVLPSLGDYLAYSTIGIPPFEPASQTPFIFPALWILFYTLICCFQVSYPFQDLIGFGKHLLISSGKRSLWWLSKCVWCVCSVGIYFLIYYLAALLFTLCSGGHFTLELNKYIDQILTIPAPAGQTREIMAVLFTMPFLTTISFSILQMTLSLFMKPFFSFGIVITCFFISTYYMHPFIFGNYAMLLRSMTWSEVGLSPFFGMIFLILLILLSGGIGWYRFCRYDIINKE